MRYAAICINFDEVLKNYDAWVLIMAQFGFFNSSLSVLYAAALL